MSYVEFEDFAEKHEKMNIMFNFILKDLKRKKSKLNFVDSS